MLFTLTTITLLGLTTASPFPFTHFQTIDFNSSLNPRDTPTTASSILAAIAPTSNTCTGAPFPSECATASDAAPYLVSSMSTYSITSPSEISALLSLIAYESGDFKYNINHYPGTPGQGTRNMQIASYNLLYAKSIPALATQLAATDTGDVNAVRALVLPNAYSWGSAAWFLTTQCASIRGQLQTGGHAGMVAYLGCVGTQMTDDRMAYWVRARQAFGLGTS